MPDLNWRNLAVKDAIGGGAFPLSAEWRGNPGERFDEAAERARVAGSLVIAEAGCGEFVRLVVTGPSAGQIWFDDMTWDHLRPGPGFRDWYLPCCCA